MYPKSHGQMLFAVCTQVMECLRATQRVLRCARYALNSRSAARSMKFDDGRQRSMGGCYCFLPPRELNIHDSVVVGRNTGVDECSTTCRTPGVEDYACVAQDLA